ncbi:MAG: type II toxin-antitoxin system Phd/YefM family antitoxin [Pseudonocardia sp.]
MTDQVGVRELRDRMSSYLARVRDGETIEITDRGRPVAMLVPPPADRATVSELVASGQLTMPERAWRPGRARIQVPAGEPEPSTVLAELRADER